MQTFTDPEVELARIAPLRQRFGDGLTLRHQVGHGLALDLHPLQPAVANQAAAGRLDDGEQAVAELRLVVQVALQPSLHLRRRERLAVEGGHHPGIAEDLV